MHEVHRARNISIYWQLTENNIGSIFHKCIRAILNFQAVFLKCLFFLFWILAFFFLLDSSLMFKILIHDPRQK